MAYQTPAPRYSRPIPRSRLAPPPGRPSDPRAALRDLVYQVGLSLRLDRVVAALSDAIERERVDHMAAIGFVVTSVGIAAAVIVGAVAQ